MNVWTIKEGEPLPVENCPGRLMRCGIISEMLAERGHDVTWWTSTFFHQTKIRLKNEETIVDLSDHFRLHMLHADKTYKKNISLSRIRYSMQLGNAFRKAARREQKPDVIFSAFPLIDLAYEAIKYGCENGIPVVVDIRDFWPDIFWEHFPKFVRPIVKLFCRPLIKKTEYILKNADCVVGVIPKCMEFAKSHHRILTSQDKVYYLAYREQKGFDKEKAVSFWNSKGVNEADFLLCWIGQISEQRTDFDLVCKAVADMPQCKLVICGDGVSRKELEEKYKNDHNIIFPGFLSQAELEVLMGMSKIGVIPIRNTPDFIDTINNKAIEYMAGSLCVMTTLKGLLKDTIEANNIGFYFETTEQFKEIVSMLMNNESLLHQYKINARNYYESNFNSEIVYGKLCNELEMIGIKEDED